MSGAEFDDDVTVDVDEALLAQIRAEAARRAAGSDDDGSSDAGQVDESADEATQDIEEEVLESVRVGDYEENVPAIDGYGALREIGRGGFSSVYEALQFEFERWVAVKVLKEALDGDEETAEFERECRLTGVLSRHPNIVTVFNSAFTSELRPCIVMELFPHGSYLNILQSTGPLGLEELLSLSIRVSGALATAHRQGMVHGDVKPQNIFRSEFGLAALGDFGIATFMSHSLGANKTRLSLYYAAPELIERGISATSPFADQYSLGATIHTLAAGRRPFESEAGETTRQLLARTLSEPAPRLGGDFPPALADALQQAMAREPHQRHRDVVAFAAAIAKVEQDLKFRPTEIPFTRDRGRYVGQTPDSDRPPSRPLTSSQDAPAVAASAHSGEPPADGKPEPALEEQSARPNDRTVVRPSGIDTVSPPSVTATPPRSRKWPLWAKVAAVAAIVAAAAGIGWALMGGDGPPPPVPEPLENVQVEGQRKGLVVSWDAPPDGDWPILLYRVQWKLLDDAFSDIREEFADSTDTSTEISGLPSDTTFEVRVAAENENGRGAWTESEGATLPEDVPVPLENVQVEGQRKGLVVSWDAPPDGDWPILLYRVQWKLLDDAFSDAREEFADSTDTSTEISGLPSDTTFEVRVAAENENGRGAWTESEGATLPEDVPVPLENVQVEGQRKGLVVSWDAPPDGDWPILLYRVQWKLLDETFSDAREELAASTDTSEEIFGLPSKTTFEVRVAAENEIGRGAWTESEGATLSEDVPVPLENVQVEGQRKGLVVSWDAPPDGDWPILLYRVQWKLLDDAFLDAREELADSTDTSAEIFGLASDTTYEVRVAAENENGLGGWGKETATTLPIPTPPPNDLEVSEHYRRLVVSWTDPSNGGSPITHYLVEWHSEGEEPDSDTVMDDGSTDFTKEIDGLVSGRTYEVQLVAVNEVGESEPAVVLGVPLDRVVFVSNLDGQDAIYYADFSTRDLAIREGNWNSVTDSDREEGSPSVSPDGSWVAFHRRTAEDTHWQIFVRNIDSRVEQQLICHSDNGWSPTWSPDGQSIAFARGSGGNDIWTINVETGEAKSLKDKFDRDDAYPSWSSDGDAIAFARSNYDPRRSRAYNSRNPREIRVITGISDATTGIGVALLTKGYEEGDYTSPDWSPDGDRIAYSISLTGSEYRHIYVMDRDGNKLQQLTQEHYDDDPSWSPDGQWIAFVRGEDGSRDLYVVSTAGGEPVPLLVHGVYDYGAPSWSPNREVRVDPTFERRIVMTACG